MSVLKEMALESEMRGKETAACSQRDTATLRGAGGARGQAGLRISMQTPWEPEPVLSCTASLRPPPTKENLVQEMDYERQL